MNLQYQDAINDLASRGIAFRFDTAGVPTALQREIDLLCSNAHVISTRSTAAQRRELETAPPGKTIFLRDFLPTLEIGLLHTYTPATPPAGAVLIPEILTSKQVADLLGCSTNTLRNQRSRVMAGEPVETPPWHTANRKVLYYASDLKQWLETRPIYGL